MLRLLKKCLIFSNAIVLTNNIKDFDGEVGVTAIKVSTRGQQQYLEAVPLMLKLDEKAKAKPSILKIG